MEWLGQICVSIMEALLSVNIACETANNGTISYDRIDQSAVTPAMLHPSSTLGCF
jgi:hypothetical protein